MNSHGDEPEQPRGIGAWLGFGVTPAPDAAPPLGPHDAGPRRKSAWNTYYPWALALYVVLSVILLVIILISWVPAPEIPGVPRASTVRRSSRRHLASFSFCWLVGSCTFAAN
jgi:hypothetical protein